MKRMNALVLKGLQRLVSAYEAGAGCEDVGGGYCEGDKCQDCAALREAAEWLDGRIQKYTNPEKS